MLSECDQKSKFQSLLETAKESLPSDQAGLEAIVADCQLKWKAEVDAELASSLILGSTKTVTGDSQATSPLPGDTFPSNVT